MSKTKPVITCDKCNKEIMDYFLVQYIDRVIDSWPEMHFCDGDCMREYLLDRKKEKDKVCHK